MANTKTAVAPANTAVADALDKINDLAQMAETYSDHGQAGVLRVKIQALVAQAKAAL
jgi:hypothetical protein